MKWILAVLITLMMWGNEVYASESDIMDDHIEESHNQELKKFDYNADKIISDAKQSFDGLSSAISDEFKEDFREEVQEVSEGIEKEIKENSSEIIEKTTEGIKKSFTESVRNYFSTMAFRIKDFFSGFFDS